MNPLHPDHLNPAERLAEIAGLLAAGLVRLYARKSSRFSSESGESLLDCFATQSGHANDCNGETNGR